METKELMLLVCFFVATLCTKHLVIRTILADKLEGAPCIGIHAMLSAFGWTGVLAYFILN